MKCVFGTPVAAEDDALRACRAAVGCGQAVEALGTRVAQEWGVTRAVRVGVSAGDTDDATPAPLRGGGGMRSGDDRSTG